MLINLLWLSKVASPTETFSNCQWDGRGRCQVNLQQGHHISFRILPKSVLSQQHDDTHLQEADMRLRRDGDGGLQRHGTSTLPFQQVHQPTREAGATYKECLLHLVICECALAAGYVPGQDAVMIWQRTHSPWV